MLKFLNVLLEHRRLVLAAPLAAMLIVAAWVLILPRKYTATASFIAQSELTELSRLSGLAAQFGFSLPGDAAGQSPEFYRDLISTSIILKPTVETRYSFESDAGETVSGDLVELLDVGGDTPELRLTNAIEDLRDATTVDSDRETGVITVRLTARWPRLAEQVLSRMLELVHEFNLNTRQSQGRAQREFIETRLEATKKDLEIAEDSLAQFLAQNRKYENSPQLSFEHDRLQRQVTLRQGVFSSLAQAYEQAKIDEVRNTPVITVVVPPEEPAKPDSRNLVLKLLLAIGIGWMVGVVLAFGNQSLRRVPNLNPAEYRQFMVLREQAGDEVRGLIRRVRRRKTGSL